MRTYERDVGTFAHLDPDTGKPAVSETLCAFRIGDWCVLTPQLPHLRDGRQPVWEPDAPWSITHAPSGQRVALRCDLWRAILLCEECARMWGIVDPRAQTPGDNAGLYQLAEAQADARERRIIERVFTKREVVVTESGEYPLKESP